MPTYKTTSHNQQLYCSFAFVYLLHRLILPKTMNVSLLLLFHYWVPPWVHQEHMWCNCQVHYYTACLHTLGNTWKKPTIKVKKFTYVRCGWLQTPSINDNKWLGVQCCNLMDTCDILLFFENRFSKGSCEHIAFLPNSRKTYHTLVNFNFWSWQQCQCFCWPQSQTQIIPKYKIKIWKGESQVNILGAW
jgi:hypothetical protein